MVLGTCRGQSSLQQLIGKNPTDFKKQKKGVQARRKAFADSAAKDSAAIEPSESAVPELHKQPSSKSSVELPPVEPSKSNKNAKRQRLTSDAPKHGKIQCPVCKRFLDAAVDVNSHIGKAHNQNVMSDRIGISHTFQGLLQWFLSPDTMVTSTQTAQMA